MQIRGKSSKKKINPATLQLEKEAKTMEEQLVALKQIIQQQKSKREDQKQTTTDTRWKAASTQKQGLRNYASNILQQKRMNSQLKKSTSKKVEDRPVERRPTSSKLDPLPNRHQSDQQDVIDKDVDEFLTQIGLAQYRDKLVGYNMVTLQSMGQFNNRDNITNQVLRELGVLPGHQIKFMRAIKELEQVVEESFYSQSRVTVQTNSIMQQSECQSKQSCWLCYKLYENTGINIYQRNFCSEECRDQFIKHYILECGKCRKQFYKNDGCIILDRYYCSERCGQMQHEQVVGVNTHTTESLSYQEEEFLDEEPNYAEQFNEFLTSSLLNDPAIQQLQQ